ncbi:DUF2917 domain-containing protein [Paraburkholderia sp.]|uniref:DUF2917 domain-containing protein n=1 Tax=Paraburkholderia sp. TaxID=1926495 RepID=UPI00239EE9A9|nr:DUF2917 domain-containing protein [Paraburkholderia sp.]MDE1183101.1 DUF2917 domain-containing protein [Paraburkholderia sp.]
MREIRTFELEPREPVSAWRASQPLVLNVMAGQVWLTVDGDAEDYWLDAGESFELPRNALAWVSAGQSGTRLAVRIASGSVHAPVTSTAAARAWSTGRAAVRSWMPRWLQAI